MYLQIKTAFPAIVPLLLGSIIQHNRFPLNRGSIQGGVDWLWVKLNHVRLPKDVLCLQFLACNARRIGKLILLRILSVRIKKKYKCSFKKLKHNDRRRNFNQIESNVNSIYSFGWWLSFEKILQHR
jgi:hypothetical protein